MLTTRERKIQQTVCHGCRHDRYNHPGICERPGIDAMVDSEKCWNLDRVVYDRKNRTFVCSVRQAHQ